MWTSLNEEESLISALESSSRIAVETLGESVEGRPIRLLRIGNPAPPAGDRATLLLTGCVHGNEPAGREAILNFAQELKDTSDSAHLSWLADNPLWLIPTVNPDGFGAGQRENANDVDINRDFITLATPEARAVAQALGRGRPYVMVDQHESVNIIDPSNDIEVNCARPEQAHQSVKDLGVELRDLMLDRATAEGWPNGVFGSTFRGDFRILDINCALRHSVACIVETNFSDDTTSGREHRLEMQSAMIEEIWSWTTGNTSRISTDVAAAIDAKIAEGEAGTEPFDLRGGTILDPPPLGYELPSGLLPAFHLGVFNVQVSSGRIVEMGQMAQPVIPYLFDAESEHTIIAATRLFDLSLPPTIATVQELAPIVSGSHTPVIEVRVLHEFQTGVDPDGTVLRVHGGNVEYDATAEVLASIEVDVAGQDPDTGRSMYPRLQGDTLAPYGTELFARRGVNVGDDILWSPLGYFRIDAVEQDDSPYGPIKISGQDRWVGLDDARLLRPREFPPQTQAASLFADLVGDVYPDATVQFDDAAAFADIGRRLIAEDSRTEVLREVASSLGKIVHWDGEGILQVRDAPDEDEPVWQVRAGRGGVLVTAARRVSREGTYNALVALGEGGDTEEPVRGVAMDVGPNSPTRWGGPFGKVPKFYSSPMIRTESQATRAARQMLRRQLGMPSNADFGAIVNPALRPWHPVLVAQRDGTRETHIVERLSIPLTADGDMTAETRERTRVVLGAVIE